MILPELTVFFFFFFVALEMVHNIAKVDKLSVFCPSANNPQQTGESHHPQQDPSRVRVWKTENVNSDCISIISTMD